MEIQAIKSHLSLLAVVAHYGYAPTRHHLLRCPFHEDKTASLQLYPKTNTWHCFGCGKGTDQIDFIQLKEKCTTHEAIKRAEELLQHLPTQPINTPQVMQQNQTQPINPAPDKEIPPEQRIQALTQAFSYFARSTQAEAKQYLQRRVLNPQKVTVGYDAHNFHREIEEELKERYLATGLLHAAPSGRANHYHSFFDNCIVFPLLNEPGEIVNLYGRCINDAGESKHRYLPGKLQGIYPKYPKAETEQLIIAECIIDCATLLQIEEITSKYELMCCYGTNNFTKEHQEVIRNLVSLNEVILFYDGDKAGREALASHAKIIKEIKPNMKISYIETPEEEDINSLAQGHEPEIFTGLLHSKKPIHRPSQFFLSKEKQEKPATPPPNNGVPPENRPNPTPELPVKEKSDTKPAKIPALSEVEGTNIPGEEKQVLSALVNSVAPLPKENETEELPANEADKNASLKIPEKLITAPAHSNGTSLGKLNTGHPNNLTYETEQLIITLQGGIELYNLKRLRPTLQLQLKANIYNDYRDTVDLYSHSQRKRLIQEVSEKLEISVTEISRVMTDLTNQLEQYRNEKLEQKRKEAEAAKKKDQETFTEQEMRAGEQLLQSEALMKTTYEKISHIGLVGQEKNGLLLFFIYLTRMVREPLHALVQGRSGSGKTYLLKKIVGLLPKIHYKCLTAITENSLYYALQGALKHTLLLLEDLEGMYNAMLPIRELMSNLFISKWTTITNPRTGEPEQKELYVEGPVCIAGATTKDKIYEDNANRSFQLQIEETKTQEEKVLEYQRKEAAGQINKTVEEKIQREFKAAQLLLDKNLEVLIPFSDELRIPDYVFKKQRTNKHYLILIKIIAFWNQKQREIKQKADGTRYIEATLEDVWWANYLCKEALLSKSDELSPQLRIFFEGLKKQLKGANQNSFLAKQIREIYRMNPMSLNRYLHELESRGCIRQVSGNRKVGFEYEIKVWDDYEQLQKGMEILDEIYERLKGKYGKEEKEEI